MRISHKYKFVFFCNPKTGSESVRELLNPYSDVISTVYLKRSPQNPFYSHITPYETKQIFGHLGWDFESYSRFVFVRNPWIRLVSLYEMIFRRVQEGHGKPDFTEWLYTIKTYGPGAGGQDWKRWQKYGSYSLDNYASDSAGNMLVNKVIKLEDVDQELIPFLAGLGLPGIEDVSVPHVNKRAKLKHYTEYYTSEAQKHVEKLYKFDIREFHYKFGD